MAITKDLYKLCMYNHLVLKITIIEDLFFKRFEFFKLSRQQSG